VDDRDIDALCREVPGNRRSDLSGPANDDFHFRSPMLRFAVVTSASAPRSQALPLLGGKPSMTQHGTNNGSADIRFRLQRSCAAVKLPSARNGRAILLRDSPW